MNPLQNFELFINGIDLSTDLQRINRYYFNIYANSFNKVFRSDVHKSNLEGFYDNWLFEMDKELQQDLVSDLLVTNISRYLDKYAKLRATFRRLGVPVDLIDITIYNVKKNYFNYLNTLLLNAVPYSSDHKVVFQKEKVRLLFYDNRVDIDKNSRIPLLIVSSLINKHNILDLSSEKSLIRILQNNGFDVYLVDWGYDKITDDNKTLEDYIGLLKEMVQTVLIHNNIKKVSIIGYCWGGLITLIFSILYKEKIKSLSLLATPIDFTKDNSLLAIWAKTVETKSLVKEYGHIPGDLLNLAFILRNPPRNIYDKYFRKTKIMTDSNSFENYIALERWLYDTRPIPGTFFIEIIENFYKENILIKNNLKVLNKIVKLDDLNIPTLCGIAEKDDLVSPDSTVAIYNHTNNIEKKIVKVPGGHVGLIIGTNAQKRLWPEISKWIKRH